ncbi:hypothetical protein SAMCFNEI73_Ch3287 [Sinorhizobium americanum]|uniref:Uncharacterized protein n=1 Tax=Sinorhizobium americanum TaxID=194963 RepID=A0A1L3LR39_9HYPH|nr:hypothetical protein SAMCFNEI73_Ch3287 [Sinorhizobium americanum]
MFDCRVGGLNRAAPNARSLNGSAIQGEAMQHFNALQRACADQGTIAAATGTLPSQADLVRRRKTLLTR